MSVQRYKLIFILVFFAQFAFLVQANDPPHLVHQRHGGINGQRPTASINSDPQSRALFSPRFEYNEWHPVGRGDPLKNDPTYDYSPPVLDRVHYWNEGLAAHKEKTGDILLLGVPSKKSSSKVAESSWPGPVSPVSNGLPLRRNYYPQQINDLPTVLMPPPLNNHLQPDAGTGDGYLWAQASNHQPQRYEAPAEGFRYRPGVQPQASHNFVSHYSGPKYPDPAVNHVAPYQQQLNPSHQYTTTLRLTTPDGSGTPKKSFLQSILKNEKAYPFTKTTTTNSVTEYTSSYYDAQNINAMATTIVHSPQTTEYIVAESSSALPTVSTDIKAPYVTATGLLAPFSTTTSTTMSPPPAVTADSLFSHFDEPPAPPKGPLFVVIEGHSRVKTYGLNTNGTLLQLPKMVPVVGSEDPVIRHVVHRDETGSAIEIPHVTMKPTTPKTMTTTTPPPPSSSTAKPLSSSEETSEERSAINSLLSLLDSSFGDYLKNTGSDNEGNAIDSGERHDKDSKARRNVRSTPQKAHIFLVGSFEVTGNGAESSASSESSSNPNNNYRKGIVLDDSPPLVGELGY
ncbi:uncharacterized protein LOC129749396 [Uranotaenia lowii]|uniref:uncharacterized protein LOC129749396 n=1 Tax=Uranotaenia lowii TaxID=190385 RepID=UPI00247AFEF4|nr:uncharacterized protein LOC129749396 [Uranotaenia lowii]XP_055600338.1 uncharacterized protein LOC129749396 [Uranotaenia lowii]XP_055600339.1 uncharacterized protein LOC129749396 [Uranotaenia lowii]XP_055600340.1 uncharacterized protein LOC129749396 [Uranotaenia lowii]